MDMSAEGVIFREMESRTAPWEAIFLDGLNKQHGGEPVYSQVTTFLTVEFIICLDSFKATWGSFLGVLCSQ